jgi:hypothetical protein
MERVDEAIDACEQALELRTATLGPLDPAVETTLHFAARMLDSRVGCRPTTGTPDPTHDTAVQFIHWAYLLARLGFTMRG